MKEIYAMSSASLSRPGISDSSGKAGLRRLEIGQDAGFDGR